LTAIMWDGREPNLVQQSIDATVGHAEATAPPSRDQQDQIVAFETGTFTAQFFDNTAQGLNDKGTNGGPVALSFELADFFVGVNDPVGQNPTGKRFDPNIFDLYKSPNGLGLKDDEMVQRRSIARGEDIFNNTNINITGVAGLNDALGIDSI